MKLKKLLTTITLSVSLLSVSIFPVYASESINSDSISQSISSTNLINQSKVTKVALNCKTRNLIVGANETLVATVSPFAAKNKSVTWKSSKTSVATVDSTGNVKGLKAGKATITVTTVDGKKTAKCTVTVATGNPVTFNDINLERTVRDIINKPTGTLYTIDVQGITSLELQGSDLIDLTGIESLINLKLICFNNNKIVNISPLKGLKKLQSISLLGNKIADINDLQGLTNLTFLHLGQNEISDITALRGMTKLTKLVLNNNHVTDISCLQGMKKLINLELEGNQITNNWQPNKR